jgi:hypothetical protein
MENLYFKLTTIPQTEDVKGKELELYFKKYQESNKLEDLNQAKEDYYLNAGKNPLFGSIYSLTVGYLNGDEVRISILKGTEKNIIQEFINLCNNEHFARHQVAGWNFSFLLPFLRIRAKKNKIHQKLHKDCEDLNKKAWTISGLDLFDAWKGLGWFQSSLEEVAELTFELNTDFVDGKDVYRLFKAEAFEKLDKSSADEIMTLINVHRGIKGEEFLTEKTISIKVLEDVKEVEQSIFEKIHKVVEINSATKEKIKDIFSKKKLTKKDKEIVEDMLVSVYTCNEMFKVDDSATKERKKQEIKELLK